MNTKEQQIADKILDETLNAPSERRGELLNQYDALISAVLKRGTAEQQKLPCEINRDSSLSE
jgi:hypothetical protein